MSYVLQASVQKLAQDLDSRFNILNRLLPIPQAYPHVRNVARKAHKLQKFVSCLFNRKVWIKQEKPYDVR